MVDRLINESLQRPDLKALVVRAFENRVREDTIGTIHHKGWDNQTVPQAYGQSEITMGKRIQQILHQNEDAGGAAEEYVYKPLPNQTLVSDFRDYHWLLRYAAEICFEYAHKPLPTELRQKLIKKDLSHEFQHALGAKGEKNVRILYGVEFMEATDGSSVSYKPFIGVEGKITPNVLRKIVQGASWLSKGDEVSLN